MKYVLHGYNVVSPRLGKNGPIDSSFDLYLLWGIVREIGRDDRFIGRSDAKRLTLITGVGRFGGRLGVV